ncbi:MAG: EFR1 family ferrodoxin [Synergistaceae bacterium]|jgi:ferredoxin|nr:EFR1 family ferrodoxin [Synergistaceae bacterium]
MRSGKIVIAVFTGTGNTLLMADALAGELRAAGKGVTLAPMERRDVFESRAEAQNADFALGIAAPVACFSTYPTAWRFIDSLPAAEGREVFFLASMGGAGGGMEGPVRRVLEEKGYMPLGALLVRMPGNYGNKTINAGENKKTEAKAREKAKKFARELLDGTARWGRGLPLLSGFLASMAHGRRPWDFFHSMFPIEALAEKCTGCGLCARICPEVNIEMADGKARIGKDCQSCQRCVAFCPAGAICVPLKPSVQYRGAPLDSILSLIGEGGV